VSSGEWEGVQYHAAFHPSPCKRNLNLLCSLAKSRPGLAWWKTQCEKPSGQFLDLIVMSH
jgi:hypothetical protein